MEKEYIERRKQKSHLIWIILIPLLVIIAASSVYVVSAGERGVLLTWGKPSDIAMTEGLHFRIPVAQKVVKMDIKTLKYETPSSAASKDLQVVSTIIAVNYKLEGSSTPKLYKEVGLDYQDKIIQPAVQEVVKAVTSKYTAEELITKRHLVKEEISTSLKSRLLERNIVVEEVSITNFDFSASFNSAIEAKVTAEQEALAAKNKLEQVKYEAEQKIVSAQAEAESIKIQSEALKSNEDILELRQIEKWDGVMPTTYVVGTGINPLISI